MVNFTWDENKNLSNIRKHGLRFEIAKYVFDDPLHISRYERTQNGEMRYQAIGMVDDSFLILVVHTWRGDDDAEEHIRIISARPASKQEIKYYEQNT